MSKPKTPRLNRRGFLTSAAAGAAVLLLGLHSSCLGNVQSQAQSFHLQEATIEDVHNAYRTRRLTSRQLVQLYLNRIEAYDKKGPVINSIIKIGRAHV